MTCPGLYAARAGIIVTKQLPAGATERALAGQAFVLLLELLGLARLLVATHFNARYGLREALCVLIAMCEASRFVTPAVTLLARHAGGAAGEEGRVPSARWFTGLLSSVAYKPMLARSGRMFARNVEMMIERGMIPSTVVAALHDAPPVPRQGGRQDRPRRPVQGRRLAVRDARGGRGRVAAYLPHIWVGPVRKGDPVHKCVGDMLREMSRLGVSIGLLLADRGFYSAAVMRFLGRMGVKFVMPVPMSPRSGAP